MGPSRMSRTISLSDGQLALVTAPTQDMTAERRNSFLLGLQLKLKISRGPNVFPSDAQVGKVIADVLQEMAAT